METLSHEQPLIMNTVQPEQLVSAELLPSEILPDLTQLRTVFSPMLEEAAPHAVRPYETRDADSKSVVTLLASSLLEERSESAAQMIRNQYIEDTAEVLSKSCWWQQAEASLSPRAGQQEAQAALQVREVHDFTVMTPEGPAGTYQVIECGTDPSAKLNEEEQQAIVDTLTIIDQFTGGALLASDTARRIVVSSIDMPHPDKPDEGVGGTASEWGTFINMQEIRRVAEANNVDNAIILGVVLTHEVLGHQLERVATDGKLGQTFEEKFTYSDSKVPGEIFNSVHESVEPIDPGVESNPVREYGRVNASEDFATAAEAMIAHVTGWEEAIAGIPRSASTPDAYRSEIVLTVMDKVADAIKSKSGVGVGYVGSPFVYQEQPDGTRKSVPARTLVHSTEPIQTMIDTEIGTLLKPYAQIDEISYQAIEEVY